MKNVKNKTRKSSKRRFVKPMSTKLVNMVRPETLIALEDFRKNLSS